MPALIIGVATGLYIGNPAFREQLDTLTKTVVSKGVDLLNFKGGEYVAEDGDGTSEE